MAYKVKVLPVDSAAGWLVAGRVVPEIPTYYTWINAAQRAAMNYMQKHPGDVCQIMTYTDDCIVEELRA